MPKTSVIYPQIIVQATQAQHRLPDLQRAHASPLGGLRMRRSIPLSLRTL